MKKKIISAITAVLMSILALAVFAACGEDDATAITHAVTFMDGETVVSTVDVEDGTALTDAQIPAAPQHTGGGVFDGWYVGETKVEAGYKPTADVTATAKYHTDETPATYTVTFKDGENTVKTVDVEEGETLTADQIPADPDHAGQVFDGWFVGETKVEAGYKPTADVTATAQYHADTPTEYTVTFYNGGDVFDTKTVTANTAVTAPDPAPTQAGQTFRYWMIWGGSEEYDFDTPVTANIRLEARFGIYITFDIGEGAEGTTPDGIWAEKYNATLPTADGLSNGEKEFAGWKDEATGDTYTAGESARFYKSVELVAQWEEPKTTYTVTYFSGVDKDAGIVGTTPDTETVEDGQSVTLPANPWKREGYLFTGYDIQHYVEVERTSPYGGSSQTSWEWQNIEGETGKQQGYSYTPHENIRITARWTESTITVKYDPNGGSGEIANTSGKYNSTIILTTEAFTAPAGKAFVGWALTEDGAALPTTQLSGKERINFSDVKDSLVEQEDGNYELTLYAVWDDIPVQISDFEGVWSGTKGQVIISEVTAGDVSGKAVGSIIIDKEYMLLYRQEVMTDQFESSSKSSSSGNIKYVVKYSDGQLTVDGNAYTERTDISDAQKSDFIGKWQRTSSTQVWNIEESKATLTVNESDTAASVYVVIDKYLVLEYKSGSYMYQFLLTKDETSLTGYFTAPDKTPAATSFTLITEGGGGGDGGGDEDLPAGDLYTPGTKVDYSKSGFLGSMTTLTIDKIVYDEEGQKLYIWGTFNGKALDGTQAYELETADAGNYKGPGSEQNPKYWAFYISGNDFYFAVIPDGTIVFCDNQDEVISNNVYNKA